MMHKTGLPADHRPPGFHLPLCIFPFAGLCLKEPFMAIIRAWILMKGDTYGTI